MHHLLAEILGEKKREVRLLRDRWRSMNRTGTPPLPVRDFKGAISSPGRINLIAEIKLASPSAGVIREGVDPLDIGRQYEGAGAAAISLVTDKGFFAGDLSVLPRLKESTRIPILRKDFILDTIQVRESFLYGADAVLLIARILSVHRLGRLLAICRELGMASLTEVHDRHDLEKAIACGAEIIGINNRDLDTLTVNLRTTIQLAPLVPHEHICVSESGIENERDIRVLKQSGVQAVLVGTAIMRCQDVGRKTRELVHACRASGEVSGERWSGSRSAA
jgi:indole-3-glycerol phosphate synthase